MNNEEIKNAENKKSNSLMRKTKVQLIDIILRKDDVEKNLREDIKGTETELDMTRTMLDSRNNDYFTLKNDYHTICDERAFVECELNTIIKKQKGFIWFLTIMFIISIIANIISYFV